MQTFNEFLMENYEMDIEDFVNLTAYERYIIVEEYCAWVDHFTK